MSKVKSVQNADLVPVVAAAPPVVPAAPVAPPTERMSNEDKLALELAKSRRETVLAQAKEALAKNENADLAYRYLVLQLYMKYQLSSADAISEDGSIIRGGAVAQTPQG